MGPVVHKDEVGVVAVQAGQVPLAVLIHDVLGRKAALGTEDREEVGHTDGKFCIVNAGNGGLEAAK